MICWRSKRNPLRPLRLDVREEGGNAEQVEGPGGRVRSVGEGPGTCTVQASPGTRLGLEAAVARLEAPGVVPSDPTSPTTIHF